MNLPAAVRSLVRSTPTIAPVPHRALLAVTGSQVQEFLSGIIASNVPPSQDCHFYTAFLHAQARRLVFAGRVLYDAFVHSYTSPEGKKGYVLEYDSRSSEAPSLLTMLKRYVLRSKVRLRDVSSEYDIWAAWGSEREKSWETEREWANSRSGVAEPMWTHGEGSLWPWGIEAGAIQDRRAVGMGHRLLVRKGDRASQSSTHDRATEHDYHIHRILHGVPEGNTDIVPMHSFPMDSNLDLMGALDFRKGCYVGQELTVRTYHTGIIRKRIFPVHIQPVVATATPSPPSQFTPDIDIRAVNKDSPTEGSPKVRQRGSGKLLSSTHGVGLALLRLEHVAAVEENRASLEFELPSEDGSSSSKWAVNPWRPDWWPTFSMDQK
ncbi:Aminomethyltransferase folate-binding domain-containing protein [Cytidiella melzeri]|nr:Aminomethyltransferase folate-binding domain-containing protein [Cytidiella melzeri]